MVISGIIGITLWHPRRLLSAAASTRRHVPDHLPPRDAADPCGVAVVALVGGSLLVVILTLGLLIWDRFAVVMRTATHAAAHLDYVAAAEAAGASTAHIVLREVLPNIARTSSWSRRSRRRAPSFSRRRCRSSGSASRRRCRAGAS